MRPPAPPRTPDAQAFATCDAFESPLPPTDGLNTAEEDLAYTRPSKSQRKRDSAALQDLGRELVELSAERLQKLPLDEGLHAAVREAQRIRSHEARRRQLQYIGKLMRDIDPAPLRQALDALQGTSAAATAELHRLEKLRERLLGDEAGALSELTRDYPHATGLVQQLRQLRRNALKEREQNKPARAYREIFQCLKSLVAQTSHDDSPLMEDEHDHE